jgi:hypothetical protein
VTLAPDSTVTPELAAAIDAACEPVLTSRPPELVPMRPATAAELKRCRGAKDFAGAAGMGWAVVRPTIARTWICRPQYTGLTDDKGTGIKVEVWEIVESFVTRCRHEETGLRVWAMWSRPLSFTPAGKVRAWTTATSWVHLDPATQFDPVPRAYCYPRQVKLTDTKELLGSGLDGLDLERAFYDLPKINTDTEE